MPTRCYAKVYWKYKYVVSLLGTSALYVPCLSNLKGEMELDRIVETLNGKHEAVSFRLLYVIPVLCTGTT